MTSSRIGIWIGVDVSHGWLAVVLKGVDLLSVAACAFVGAIVIPGMVARGIVPAAAVPAFALGALPLVVVAVISWGLFSRIGRGRVFVGDNVVSLRRMGVVSAVDALVWLICAVAYVLAVAEPAFSVVAALSVALIFAIALCIVCIALAILTERAAAIKSENDLVV